MNPPGRFKLGLRTGQLEIAPVSSRRLWWAGALSLCLLAPARASPEAARGEQIYARCQACHALSYDRVGPRHCGLIGRKAGSVPGFAYSAAMKNSHLVWDEATLDRFLASPLKTVPGTAMTYDGVTDAKDRTDLIAYLKSVDATPECKAMKTKR